MTIIPLLICERWPNSCLLWPLPLDRQKAVDNHQQKRQRHGDGEQGGSGILLHSSATELPFALGQ